MAEQNQKPGLVKAHADYAYGAAEGAVGSVTGSEAWKQSGESNKQAAVDAMKEANANRDPQSTGYGKVEEVAGKAVGCEGMEEEGAQSKKQ